MSVLRCVSNLNFEFPEAQFGEAGHEKLILNITLPPNGLHWEWMPKELQKTNILATQNTSFLYLLDQKAIKNELQTSNHCVNQLRQQKKKKIKVVTVSSL